MGVQIPAALIEMSVIYTNHRITLSPNILKINGEELVKKANHGMGENIYK